MPPPVNFRDVGEWLALLMPGDPPFPPGRLFRGGRIEPFTRRSDLGSPRTILNLRRGPDATDLDGVALLHVPADDTFENYQTELRPVQEWIRRALGALADPSTEYPVYVHCTSGKDRTGIVISAALVALGVPDAVIVDEYLQSEGVRREHITHALAGLRAVPADRLVSAARLARALRGAETTRTRRNP